VSCGKITAINMALDLKKLFNRRYDFEFNLPTLGRLQCRALSMQVLDQLEKMLADKDLTGRPFIVKLLEQVAERSPANGETEQEGTPVTAAEAEQLTDEEIEAFAKDFLAHNPSLLQTFENPKTESRTNEKGERISVITPRAVDFPKEPDERDSDYLARVMRRDRDERAKRIKHITESASGIFRGAGLSKTTEDILRQNLLFSDRLREMTASFDALRARTIEMPAVDAWRERPVENPALRIPNLPPNPAYETIARLNEVLAYMEGIRPLAAECANLIRSMNDTSIRMLADFSRNARQTAIYNRITIWIAVLGLVVSAVFSVLNYFDDRLNQQLGAHVQTLSEAQDQRMERLIAAFQEFLSKQSAEDRDALVEALRKSAEPSKQKPPQDPVR
jgi:hypothetical protein